MFNAHVLCFAAMRQSPLKHPLAILRTFLGLTQKEMASLVGREPRTIQAIELGQLKLSIPLCLEITIQTGVSPEWLMNDDISAPMVNASGEPYSKEDYEDGQIAVNQPKCDLDAAMELYRQIDGWGNCFRTMSGGFIAAHKKGKASLFSLRLYRAIAEVCHSTSGCVELKSKPPHYSVPEGEYPKLLEKFVNNVMVETLEASVATYKGKVKNFKGSKKR